MSKQPPILFERIVLTFQELKIKHNMVRTKWSPKPHMACSPKAVLRLYYEPNDNSIQQNLVNYPMRVKLKAKRKFSEKHMQKELGTNNTNTATLGHKRQKSAHRILTTTKVNLNKAYPYNHNFGARFHCMMFWTTYELVCKFLFLGTRKRS